MNTHSRGFTVIELLFIVVILGAASVLFFIQRSNVEVAARDNVRKTSINALYYSLEEVFFKEQGYYPQTIEETTLRSVDPALLADPAGVKINEANSDYRYEPVNCTDAKCKAYTLRATLENEDDFVKTSRNN